MGQIIFPCFIKSDLQLLSVSPTVSQPESQAQFLLPARVRTYLCCYIKKEQRMSLANVPLTFCTPYLGCVQDDLACASNSLRDSAQLYLVRGQTLAAEAFLKTICTRFTHLIFFSVYTVVQQYSQSQYSLIHTISSNLRFAVFISTV